MKSPWEWLRGSRASDFAGTRALVTGGSRGLGLILATELSRRGATVAICARNEPELLRAKETIAKKTGGEILTFVCDVSKTESVSALATELKTRWGNLDLLANVAGIIQVSPLEMLSMEDFKQAIDINMWGPIHVTMALLPLMIRPADKATRRIINVTSIGGVVPVPHLLPYTVSKFGFVGFSQGLRAELKKHDISVTTVVPGLMRTGSFVNAYFKGKDAEFSWFSLGATMPFVSMDAARAAHRMIEACKRGRGTVTIGMPAKLLRLAFALFPSLGQQVLSAVDRFILPKPPVADRMPGQPDDRGERAVQGLEVQARNSANLGAKLASHNRSSLRFNEKKKAS